MGSEFRSVITSAEASKDSHVESARAHVDELLSKVDLSNANPNVQQHHAEITAQLSSVMKQFQETASTHTAEVSEQVAAVKKFHQNGTYGLIGGLVLGLILLVTKTGLGIFLLLVVAVGWIVFKKMSVAKAKAVETKSWEPARNAMNSIGRTETLHTPASGLVAAADQLYLEALDPAVRGMEQQRRTSEKQMQIMQQQHAEAMSAQAAQLEEMRQQQQATNDLLTGGPNFLGAVARGRDAAKRAKKQGK